MVMITGQGVSDEIRRQQQLARSIAADQAAISSTKKLNAPSDDPQAWVEISEIGRAQAIQVAWTDNVAYGKNRAAKADANLTSINELFSRARELLVQASSTSQGEPGRDAILADFAGIKKTMNELLNETDFEGTPVFDDGVTIAIPVARGLTLDAVGTRQSISEGVNVDGTIKSLNEILDTAMVSVQSGDSSALNASLTDVREALDHVIVAQSVQGVRSQRLDDAGENLLDSRLVLSERRSALEDTDLTEVLTRMQSNQLTLEAAQAAFARINRQTLFDLLG